MAANDSAGSSGISQAKSRKNPALSMELGPWATGSSAASAEATVVTAARSPMAKVPSALEQIGLGEVDAATVAIDEQHDGQADPNLGRGHRDHE